MSYSIYEHSDLHNLPHPPKKEKSMKCLCLYMFIFPGTIKQPKKKNHAVKEGKGKTHSHIQTLPAQATHQSQAAGLQSSSQMKQQQHHHHHQPSPAGFMAPSVAPLESSQLLETSFDSLPPFGQPIMHMSHHTGNASSSPAPSHLNTHSAGPVSPETHPFLNQHSVLPSPGKVLCRGQLFDDSSPDNYLGCYCF